jgi:hypothetical protein
MPPGVSPPPLGSRSSSAARNPLPSASPASLARSRAALLYLSAPAVQLLDTFPSSSASASSTSSSSPLAEVLRGLPRLSDSRDREQIDGLSRLATALYTIAAMPSSSSSSSSQQQQGKAGKGRTATGLQLPAPLLPLVPPKVQHQLEQSASFLSWLSSELSSLSPDERQAALMIPLELFTRVSGCNRQLQSTERGCGDPERGVSSLSLSLPMCRCPRGSSQGPFVSCLCPPRPWTKWRWWRQWWWRRSESRIQLCGREECQPTSADPAAVVQSVLHYPIALFLYVLTSM